MPRWQETNSNSNRYLIAQSDMARTAELTRIYEMSLGDWEDFWMPLQTVDALFVGGISLITTKAISTQSCP